MLNSLITFETNCAAWVRIATLGELVIVLETIGRELLLQRGCQTEHAGVTAVHAAHRLRPLAEPVVAPVGSHAAAKYQDTPLRG